MRAPRPRYHGDPALLALESEVYRVLREIEEPIEQPEYVV